MGWQIHSPCQGGSAHQALDMPLAKVTLNQISVLTQHSSMMNGKAVREEFLQGSVPGFRDLLTVGGEETFKGS
jgi:hypothetical protein